MTPPLLKDVNGGMGGVAGRVLQNPFVTDRVGIKNRGNAFLFLRGGDAGDHD